MLLQRPLADPASDVFYAASPTDDLQQLANHCERPITAFAFDEAGRVNRLTLLDGTSLGVNTRDPDYPVYYAEVSGAVKQVLTFDREELLAKIAYHNGFVGAEDILPNLIVDEDSPPEELRQLALALVLVDFRNPRAGQTDAKRATLDRIYFRTLSEGFLS